MPEIKSADAAELASIMGQAAAASGSTIKSGKTGDAAADNDGEAAKAAAPAKPYMLFDAGEVRQESGIAGIKFDFNYGARVTVPQGEYRVKFIDREACLTVYDAPASGVLVTSSKKYFIDFRIEVYEKGKLIFAHDLDLQGKKVLLKFPVGILGDILAWFPYAEIFRKKHKCELYCAMAEDMIEIIKPGYPEINFVQAEERPEGLYASYYMGIFFPCDDREHQPMDWRVIGLHQNAAMILGVDPGEKRIRLLPKNKTRRIKEPYVCIAAQASSQAKYWNNGRGWLNVVKHLKERGYRVLCIDRENVYAQKSRYNIIPYGTEDFTGRRPLQERIDLLYHADFFVGLPSGLSWLAYGVGKPVVMISGMSLALTEFPNKYRVQNFHVCNGCWNDTRITFDHKDFEWCPRHKGTDRQFECSRYITPEAVNKVIDRLIADYKLKPQKEAVNKKKIKGEQ
ncbi:autotransporter strand-loop-strand O-heptosyltransferase [uncultured Phascolarctobacterium sp.]|uniref:autotransporter strand-loop-strand O-heptosyltransferase n=1 Tax=uncultured Phascolarctobacterium sp. TaxID=512296 RepID=UPI0027D95E8B|nr:autotransporter strand-loop-strand O-heptosyltransferase [uncultured Phascolarctobacterium sp.]